jgi:hypothetical protein
MANAGMGAGRCRNHAIYLGRFSDSLTPDGRAETGWCTSD